MTYLLFFKKQFSRLKWMGVLVMFLSFIVPCFFLVGQIGAGIIMLFALSLSWLVFLMCFSILERSIDTLYAVLDLEEQAKVIREAKRKSDLKGD